MPKSLDTLNRIADLLPEEQRERFFAMIARLRNVPEDDEYLLILEAIGFMTLIWREVPAQVQRTIAAAGLPNDAPQSSAYLLNELSKTISAALDVPTYADMRQIAAHVEEQHSVFKTSIAHVLNRLDQLPAAQHHRPSWIVPILCVALGAILALAIEGWLPLGDTWIRQMFGWRMTAPFEGGAH